MSAGADAIPREPIWTPRLLGLRDRRLDLALTILAVAVLAVSRFAVLADGPWEQDEAIFARSVLEFAPQQHFPHPPFFPGWIAIGYALTPITGDPLRAYQIATALTSLLCLWPLAAIGRRVASPLVAFACAFGVQFLAGPWVFAVRGFSDTAAAFLALLAAAIMLEGFGSERFLLFSGLIAGSFLVRPVLLPNLLVLWLVAAWMVRDARRVFAGGALGVLMSLVGYAPFAAASGGLGGLAHLFVSHGEEHFEAVEKADLTLARLGIVTDFGGVAAAAVALAVTLIGLEVWRRRHGWRSATVYAASVAVLVAMLVFAHVPTFPRYSVPLVLAVAPLAAAALSLLPAAPALVTVAGATALSAAVWLPLLVEQHPTRFPMWEAVATACDTARAAPVGTQVLAGRGGWAFAAYYDSLMRRGGAWAAAPRAAHWAPPYSGPPAVPHWIVVTGWYRDVLPWAGAHEVASCSGVSAKAEALSQHRFLTGLVVSDLALQRGTWWPAERDAGGRPFAWCSAGAVLSLPGAGPDDHVRLTVRAAPGAEPLRVSFNHQSTWTVPGDGKVVTRRIPPEVLFADRSNSIFFDRRASYAVSGKDDRPVAAAVYPVALVNDDTFSVSFGDTARLDELGIAVQDFYGKETFRDGVVGRWTKAHAWMEVPAAGGVATLTLLAPRPGPTTVEVFAGAERIGGPWTVPTVPQEFTFDMPSPAPGRDSVRIELRANPYSPPSRTGRPSRELGVVVSELAVAPHP